MKRFLKTAIAMLALTGAFFALTACNKVTDVSVATNPQLVFVQGNPIDLSLGTLSVADEKTSKEIPMDAKGVTVSGYNANQLGTQEITISYEGKSTTLTVEVVPRMKIEGAIVDYFVGESFDTSKGRIRVYKDDGTQSTVQLNNSAVTVKDFDSSKATSPLEITIAYKTGMSEYTQSLDVNVYDVVSNDFKEPNVISYKSHDDAINLKGGLITLYSEGKKATRYVQMESVKVSGFDLSKAGIEHMAPNKPLEQTITLTYGAFKFEYKIYITYTEVSLVKDLAKELMELDWSQEEFPEISKELGESALLAADTFINLSAGDKLKISSEEQVYIALAASVYGRDVWEAEAEKYKDVFTLEGGFDFVDGIGYAEVKEAYDALSANPDSPLFTTAATLMKIADEFGETPLKEDGTKVGAYLKNVFDPAKFEEEKVLARMKYLTELYEAIPQECTVDTVGAHQEAIENALTIIKNGGFNTYNYRMDHDMMNAWRAEEDFFDILYAYLYQTNKLEDALATVQNIGLPGLAEELYQKILRTYAELIYLENQVSYETTWFKAYYSELLDLENQNKNDTGMYKFIYDNAKFGGITAEGTASFKELRTILERNGFYVYFYPVYGNETTEGHWDTYISILAGYREAEDKNAYYQSSDFQTLAKRMFDEFVAMVPSDQVSFLTTLAPVYAQYGVSILDLAENEDGAFVPYNFYRKFLMEYSKAVLTPALVDVFDKLLVAMESYAFAPHLDAKEEADSGINPFLADMKNTVEAYEALAAGSEEKTTFDTLFGEVYAKYNALHAKLTATEQTPTDLGDYADEFEAVKDALLDAGKASAIMQTFYQDNKQIYLYNVVFGAYEQARMAVEKILASGNEAVIFAYYYESYDVYGDGTYYTADMAYEDVRSYAMNVLLMYNLYEKYQTMAPKAFFAQSANQILDVAEYLMNVTFQQTATLTTKPEEVKAVMDTFLTLTDDEKYYFFAIDMDMLYQYSILFAFENMSESENWANSIMMLLNVEFAYNYYYTRDPDGYMDSNQTVKTKDGMQGMINEFYNYYNALTEEEKALFEQWFGDLHTYCVEKYEAAGITIPTQGSAEEQPAA